MNDERIRAEVRSGARSTAEVSLRCRAGSCCGGCLPLVAEVVEDESERIVHLRSVQVA